MRPFMRVINNNIWNNIVSDYQHLKEIKSAAPYISAYAISCACFYLVAYWSSFNINPFHYIGAGDILVKSGMYLFGSTVYLVFVVLLESMLPNFEPTTKEIASDLKHLKPQVVIVIIAAVIIVIGSNYIPKLYLGLSGCAFVLIRPISNTQLIRQSFSSQPIRVAAAALVVSLPTFSFFSAKLQTEVINDSDKSMVMIRNFEGPCTKGCALIGRIGDYFSVRGSNGKVLMIKADEMKMFEVYKES